MAAINYFKWCSWAGIVDQSSPTCRTPTGLWAGIVDHSSPTRGGTRTSYENKNLFPTGNRNPLPTGIGNEYSFPIGSKNPFPTGIGKKYLFPTCLKCTHSKCSYKCTICPFSNTLIFLGWLLHHLSLHCLCHLTRLPPPLDASLLHLALAPLTPFLLFSRITHRPWQAFLFDNGCQRMSGWRWEHCLVFGRGGERAHFLGFCAVTSDVCVCKLDLFWDRK